MTKCNKEQYPTLWEELHTVPDSVFIENKLRSLFSESFVIQFETLNMRRRLNLLPNINVEGSPITTDSPIEIWCGMLESIVLNSPLPVEVIALWENYRKSSTAPQTVATEKDFPAPNGDPVTAYVDNMRESTFQDRPPTAEEFEKILSMPSAFEIYNRIFDPLFVGVL